jgi:ribulose-phosphate 3-epimerase
MSIHTEVSPHLQRQLNHIRELGCRAGAVVNPSTPLTAVSEVVADLDLLLVMTVNPGYGGQKFIKGSVDKVRRAREMLAQNGSKAFLEVDGGIDRKTIRSVWEAGADTFVAGNAIFGAKSPEAEIEELRSRCTVRV